MAPLRKRRCTAMALTYNKQIYLFGGFSDGEQPRLTSIERYNQEQDSWEELAIKLAFGIEAGYTVSIKPNEFILVGGQKDDGVTNDTFIFNLKNWTLSSLPKMVNKRALHKGCYKNGFLYCVGGDAGESTERYDVELQKWEVLKHVKYRHLASVDQGMKLFGHAQPSLHVPMGAGQKKEETLKSFTFLTTTPPPEYSPIHRDRLHPLPLRSIPIPHKFLLRGRETGENRSTHRLPPP